MVRGLENIICKDLKKKKNLKKVERVELKIKDENYCSQQTHYKPQEFSSFLMLDRIESNDHRLQ